MSKTFDDFMIAQDVIKHWYESYPDQAPPDWMVKRLRETQEAYEQTQHDTPPDQAMRAANAPPLPELED